MTIAAAVPTGLKLTYFDIPGLAEVSRLLMHYGEIPFEDKRLSFDEFKEVKDTFLFKQVPVLEIEGGGVLAQSGAISRYLAKLVNVYPQDPWQLGQVEMTMGAFKDLSPSLVDIKYKTKDETEKAEKSKKFIHETLPTYLGPVEQYTPETGFIHGEEVTLADFCAFSLFEHVLSSFEEFDASKYPKLSAVVEKVRALPTLTTYLKK